MRPSSNAMISLHKLQVFGIQHFPNHTFSNHQQRVLAHLIVTNKYFLVIRDVDLLVNINVGRENRTKPQRRRKTTPIRTRKTARLSIWPGFCGLITRHLALIFLQVVGQCIGTLLVLSCGFVMSDPTIHVLIWLWFATPKQLIHQTTCIDQITDFPADRKIVNVRRVLRGVDVVADDQPNWWWFGMFANHSTHITYAHVIK